MNSECIYMFGCGSSKADDAIKFENGVWEELL